MRPSIQFSFDGVGYHDWMRGIPGAEKAVLDALGGGSTASYAVRFAEGFDGMFMVLSGMSTTDQMEDNLDNMRKNAAEIDAICNEVREIEHDADDIYSSFMSHLFKEEKDTVELIKKKNIIQALEDTCDSTKVVSDLVRSILVKMS